MRPSPDGERQALQVAHAPGLEDRQGERLLQGEGLVADDLERQSEAGRHLGLIGGRLRGEAEHGRADLPETGIEVAEAFRLRRGAVRARDVVPVGRVGDARPAGPRIAVDDGASRQLRETEVAAGRGRESDSNT